MLIGNYAVKSQHFTYSTSWNFQFLWACLSSLDTILELRTLIPSKKKGINKVWPANLCHLRYTVNLPLMKNPAFLLMTNRTEGNSVQRHFRLSTPVLLLDTACHVYGTEIYISSRWRYTVSAQLLELRNSCIQIKTVTTSTLSCIKRVKCERA